MLTRLRVKNFKSWRDTGEMRLAPLTGIFGANSSGKTSLLQVLLMLRQTVESLDRQRVLHLGDEHALVDLGTFSNLIHGHDVSQPLEIGLSYRTPGSFLQQRGKPPRRETDELSFHAAIKELAGRMVVDGFHYSVGNTRFGMRRLPDTQANGQKSDNYEVTSKGHELKRTRGRPSLLVPIKCYGFPAEALRRLQEPDAGILIGLDHIFEQTMSHVRYLGPLREYPRPRYVWSGGQPADVGVRGEQTIAALLAARSAGMTSGRGVGRGRRYQPIEERILTWMQAAGLVHSFSLQPVAEDRRLYEFVVRKSAASTPVLITDIGFGFSQILPVLVLCYYVPEGSTVILEQPEIHLHPSVQADLADLLVDVVTQRKVQIIVESHSEHLLRRLQRRIAEGVLAPQDAAIYFARVDNGESVLQELSLDQYGNITNWPSGFFGDEVGDLVKMTEAAMERQQQPQP